jgi:diadenosine tetraphosphate (Ap4A) HIT family hydrolase
MNNFILDPRLKSDCFVLSESEHFILLLMNNSLVPWFILVPKTDKTELFELDDSHYKQVFTKIAQISEYVENEFKPDKLNIAAIGNIVEQLHIHIIARYKTDIYWPGVVWGSSEKQTYEKTEVEKIKSVLNSILVI